jgi:hypothetical protein
MKLMLIILALFVQSVDTICHVVPADVSCCSDEEFLMQCDRVDDLINVTMEYVKASSQCEQQFLCCLLGQTLSKCQTVEAYDACYRALGLLARFTFVKDDTSISISQSLKSKLPTFICVKKYNSDTITISNSSSNCDDDFDPDFDYIWMLSLFVFCIIECLIIYCVGW